MPENSLESELSTKKGVGEVYVELGRNGTTLVHATHLLSSNVATTASKSPRLPACLPASLPTRRCGSGTSTIKT